MNMPSARIAVVIPCFRVRDQVLQVISAIGPEVGWIFAVDDACPEHSGDWIEANCRDSRVTVLRHAVNLGVGGAVLTGYRAALETPAKVVVKIDGDGQMDPAQLSRFAWPLLAGLADYAKGNRFHRLSFVQRMPWVRLVGNAVLSFLTKLSSGYWQVADPTNGYTAIRREVVEALELDRVARRYFFESDLLHHLNALGAVVADIPMEARYGGEPSSLRPLRMIGPFLLGHARNTARRVLYEYFVRGFSLASVELVLGATLVTWGSVYGIVQWIDSVQSGSPATAGTVMLAALPIILGTQLLLSWLNFDVNAEPRMPIHPRLKACQPQQD